MMGAVTPETCRVTLQQINICILLHLVGFLLTLNYDARNHELKIRGIYLLIGRERFLCVLLQSREATIIFFTFVLSAYLSVCPCACPHVSVQRISAKFGIGDV